MPPRDSRTTRPHPSLWLHPSLRRARSQALFLLSLFLAHPGTIQAGDLLRVPDDYPTIASAVAAAFSGQTVGVRAGTYVGQFSLKDNVDVLGGYDPIFAIRDPEQFVTVLMGSPRVIDCDGCGAGSQTVVDGFTMRAPAGNLTGGIVFVNGASPTISHCRFENGVGFRGGAVALISSGALLSDNVFVGNQSNEVGGALSIFSGNQSHIERCQFEGNLSAVSGGGIFLHAGSGIEVRDCTFVNNQSAFYGGGVLVQQSTALLIGDVFVENSAVNGGAIGVFSTTLCDIASCTLVRNTGDGAVYASLDIDDVSLTRSIVASSSGGGVVAAAGGVIANSCNDVWGNTPDYSGVIPGANTFSLDPQFCDPLADFHLLEISPCAPDNSPQGCGLIGALDVECGGADFIRVPDDYPTVTAALQAATNADTVAVAEGHYLEHVTLKDRVVLLGGYRSDFALRDPIAHPSILDAGGFLSTVVAQNNESPATVIDGFVITGGNRSGGFGGGLDCFDASPTVRNNVFIHNRARQGGAIACRAGALPLITGNLIVGNHAQEHPGGAIYVESDVQIDGNTLDRNRGPSASGIAVAAGAQPIVAHNIIVNGTGIGVYAENGAEPILGCNDVWMNIGGNYFGVLPGTNSFSLDPLFCAGDQRLLSEGSPCSPENSPQPCGLIGARGVGCTATTGVAGSAPPAEPWIGIVAPNPAAGQAALSFGLPSTAPVLHHRARRGGALRAHLDASRRRAGRPSSHVGREDRSRREGGIGGVLLPAHDQRAIDWRSKARLPPLSRSTARPAGATW